MKPDELRKKSIDELNQQVNEQLERQFKLRMQHATSQLGQSHQIKGVRRNIARIKTILNEKESKSND